MSDQEIRHAMHQNVAKYLKGLTESAEFTTATRKKISPERMLDRDFVNRFLAFYLFDYKNQYSSEDNLDTFMNRSLDKLAKLTEAERKDIAERFKAAMKLSTQIRYTERQADCR